MNRRLQTIVGATLVLIAMNSRSVAAIITPSGVFNDCRAAVAFRNGELAESLAFKFENYDASKEQIIAAFLEKYQKERERLTSSLPKIANEKKKIVYVAFVQLGVSMFLEEYTKKIIGSSSLSPGDKQILEAVMNKSNGLKVDVAASIAKGEIDGQGIAISQVKALADILASATSKGLIAPPVVLAGRIYSVGSVLIPATADWLDKDVEQQNVEQILGMSAEATRKLTQKSTKSAIDDINRTKASIDSQCK